ncbi:hypothetical protein [Tabrizicola thermarum]|uniref:hypothetical protein n=1 Tax=Tabrizicola thermarum TaxID=2670345 RepID=UPI000FFBD055|nr:hypothetical protein [Tabrizicola thermarum]
MTLAGKSERLRSGAVARAGLVLGLGTLLSGCGGFFEGVEGTQPYSGPDSVIATAEDYGHDKVALKDGEAAIAYDPDGCQVWIIDDGIEGYSSPRFDPRTGLPVCDGKYPPGTVIGVYETSDAGIPDRVSGPASGHIRQ